MAEQKNGVDSSATSGRFSKHEFSIFTLREVIKFATRGLPQRYSKASEFHILTADGASFHLEFFTSFSTEDL